MAGEIYFNNLTGRFDWGQVVDSIIRLRSVPIRKLSEEAKQLQTQQSALSRLSTAIKDLEGFLSDFEPRKLTQTRRAISSDESVLVATASEKTPEINLKIRVEGLAQKEVLLSNFSIQDVNAFVSWNAFSLRFATDYGNYRVFDIPAGSGRLSDLVELINRIAGDYIEASVYFDGRGYKLMLTERSEELSKLETDVSTSTYVISEASPMSINGVYGLEYDSPLQLARNARIAVGDRTFSYVTSASNTFENLVSGLSITVKRVGEATIRVQKDSSGIVSRLRDFVEKYNRVVQTVNELTAKDALFQGDYTIFGIKSGLSRRLTELFALDVLNLKEDGTLELNSSAVSSLAQREPEKLLKTLEGFRKNLLDYVSGLSSFVSRTSASLEDRIGRISARVEYLQRQLVKEEERLRLEYSKIEAFMNRAQEIMMRLQAFMVSLSESQGGKR